MTEHQSSADDAVAARPRAGRALRWGILGVVVVAVAAAGAVAWRQAAPVVEARKYASVTYTVPKAPKLTARPGETIYRIDPTRSSLTYAVQERFAGRATSTARGVTNGIAGDIALNGDDLAKSRVGQIVVNVEQFHSDNNLRDARIRKDYLASHTFPLATFTPTAITGLEGPLQPSVTQPFTIEGYVTIKGIKAPATFAATGKLADGALRITATTKAKLSRFEAGPISIAGLVSTSDDVTLTLKLVALDPTESAIPTRITGPKDKAANGSGPSYADTIQPILEQSCASCHNSGQMGASHWTLDDAGDARAVADGLVTVTKTGYMPPWPASDKGVALAHDPRLSGKQVAAIADWVQAGAQLDVPASTKVVPPKAELAVRPRADKTLRTKSYTGDIVNTNDYRCFVLDPKLTSPKYLTGYTFLGDQLQEIHHAQVFHISGRQAKAAEQIDGKDGQPGWGCYGGPGLRGRGPKGKPGRVQRDVAFSGQDDLVAGWVPGQAPVVFPQGSGVYMNPGDALVLQLHYHWVGEPVPDQSGLALQLDPVSSKTKVLRVINPIAPVEIPCAPEDRDEPLCDRDAAIADDVRLYGPSGAGNEAGLLALCGLTPEELTRDFDGRHAKTVCDLKVPESGTIVGVLGHEHTLGSSFRFTLHPESSKPTVLLDIPHWSFDWQMNYELAKPIHVEAGDTIRMACTWDRALDPNRTPKYIVFAEGTEDEMCFGTYAIIPDEQ